MLDYCLIETTNSGFTIMTKLPGKISNFVTLITILLSLANISNANASTIVARPAPEFTQTSADAWLGSTPLTMADLRGKVVLVDFWTFTCWNCYRSFPWLNALEEKFVGKDFQVIGIHSPEFEKEKNKSAVEKHMKKYGLKHPTMMDNDFAFWRKMGNKYWPSFYLIDKRGFLRHVFIGETHEGDWRADIIENAINDLLSEVK